MIDLRRYEEYYRFMGKNRNPGECKGANGWQAAEDARKAAERQLQGLVKATVGHMLSEIVPATAELGEEQRVREEVKRVLGRRQG